VNDLQAAGQIRKGQNVRLFDIWLLGPWLIYLGLRRARGLSGLERTLLVGVGAGTIWFNGRNFLRIEAELAPSDAPKESVETPSE
jgi:hypothetical protein